MGGRTRKCKFAKHNNCLKLSRLTFQCYFSNLDWRFLYQKKAHIFLILELKNILLRRYK